MNKRDKRIDAIKGFLIILVVLGHLLGNDDLDVASKCCKSFIYTFHMPLFVLVSGYLTTIKNDISVFWRGILNILVPLCVFQSVNIICIIILGGKIGIDMLFIPYWTLWYLLSLIFWRIMFQFSPNSLLKNMHLYILITLIVAVFSGLLPNGRVLSIQRTLNFYPFFLCGYYMNQKGMIQLVISKYKPFVVTSSVFIGGSILALILLNLYPIDNMLLLRGADHYGFSLFPAKIYLLTCSFLLSIIFCNLFYLILNNCKVLSVVGRDSLFFYLYHGIIIKFAIKPIISHFGLPQSLPFMMLYCLIIIVMLYLMSKVKLFRWIANPFKRV
jgi:fucose 4-O-acetylase-like acetyltransferase